MARALTHPPIFAPWQRVFGYSEFRSPQRAIINATMSQTDVFVIMPTGGGKSLCYQLPALLERGLTVVVRPLRRPKIPRDSCAQCFAVVPMTISLDGGGGSGGEGGGR